MNDSKAYLQEHFGTLQRTGQEIESRQLSIIIGGPQFKESLHHLTMFVELKDSFWTETWEWALANMGGTSGAEFDAWADLVTFVADRMPEHLKNRPRR